MSKPDSTTQLEEQFSRALALSEKQASLSPEDFVTELGKIAGDIQSLDLEPSEVSSQAEAFTKRRLRLIDDRNEYRNAGAEMLVLSMALVHHGPAACEVLKLTLLELSNDLGAPGVAGVFGRVLKRLQGLARMRKDSELQFWVEAIVAALPDGS